MAGAGDAARVARGLEEHARAVCSFTWHQADWPRPGESVGQA
jgi:hypothetical protein